MRRKKIGTMDFHGSVDITDPCYNRDVWCRMTDVNIRNGVYTCILFVAAAIGNDKQNIERIYGDSFLDITDLNQLPTKLTGVVKRHIRV